MNLQSLYIFLLCGDGQSDILFLLLEPQHDTQIYCYTNESGNGCEGQSQTFFLKLLFNSRYMTYGVGYSIWSN
jgi:hypothetical protein